ncbi:MAG: hypothetical protein WC565_04505 [Parcubacteria group bacterium]
MPTQATLLERIRMLESRVNYLERGLLTGTAGTYRRTAVFTKTGIADNSATAIFTVTTTDETGSADGGGFVCDVSSLCGHAIANNATNLAIVWEHCVFQRINIANGTDYGAVGEISEGGATESSSATRGIASVTPTVTLTSNTVTTFNLTIDLDGSDVTTAQAVCRVEMLWWGYLTAPVMAAA